MIGARSFSNLKGCSENCGEDGGIEHEGAVLLKLGIAAPPIFIITCFVLAAVISL